MATGKYGCGILKKILDYAVFDFEDIPAALPEQDKKGSVGLSEYDSLVYLAEHGVPIPPQQVAATADEAVSAAEVLGYPLSVKIHSADIQHKSDVGGVKLNIRNAQELTEAFDTIMTSCAKNAPDARLEGVLLKPMLKTGAEMIIGISNSRQFGPMLMVGMGGVFVEIFKDVQLAPVPLSKAQAMKMIKALKAYPLLCGYRGGAVCDVDALAELMVKIGAMAAEGKDEIKELDLNPVFVTEDGASIADALLVRYEEGGNGQS